MAELIVNTFLQFAKNIIYFFLSPWMVKSVHDIFDPQFADEEADLIKLL